MDISRLKRLRWRYLITAVILFLFLGLSYGWSIFRGPLESDFGWTKNQTALVFTIQICFFSVGGLLSGVVTRRMGPRFTMFISAFLIGAGFFWVSKIDSLTEIYIAYGVLFGTGVGLCYNAVLSTVVRWFPEKQGTISGIVLFGYGSGAMILGTIAAEIIVTSGWRNTFLIFSVVFPVMILVSALILREPSEEFLDNMSEEGEKKVKPSVHEYTPGDMVRHTNFWFFEIYSTALAAAGFAMINESTPFAETILGDDLTRAAAIAGIVSVFNGAGRILGGTMFDKIGYRKTMTGIVVLYVFSTVALFGALTTGSVVILVASYVLIGTSYGCAVPMNSAFAAYYFGRKNYGINYSIINLNPIAGAILGPMLGGGDYFRTIVVVGCCAVVGGVMMLFLKK